MSTSKVERMLLERVQHGEVSFTFEPNARGRVKLVRSTTSGVQQKNYHDLAVRGYLAESVTGTPGHSGPPTTKVAFTLTSLGRAELGLHAQPQRPVHWTPPVTEADLLKDAIE